jgi:hypothetical protein
MDWVLFLDDGGVRHLQACGYRLRTASGECSAELAGYLEGMGVRHCFQRLYGPDLVNTLKEGTDYYARIFADAGVSELASARGGPSVGGGGQPP